MIDDCEGLVLLGAVGFGDQKILRERKLLYFFVELEGVLGLRDEVLENDGVEVEIDGSVVLLLLLRLRVILEAL